MGFNVHYSKKMRPSIESAFIFLLFQMKSVWIGARRSKIKIYKVCNTTFIFLLSLSSSILWGGILRFLFLFCFFHNVAGCATGMRIDLGHNVSRCFNFSVANCHWQSILQIHWKKFIRKIATNDSRTFCEYSIKYASMIFIRFIIKIYRILLVLCTNKWMYNVRIICGI